MKKKLLVLTTIFILIFNLTACGQKKETSNKIDEKPKEEEIINFKKPNVNIVNGDIDSTYKAIKFNLNIVDDDNTLEKIIIRIKRKGSSYYLYNKDYIEKYKTNKNEPLEVSVSGFDSGRTYVLEILGTYKKNSKNDLVENETMHKEEVFVYSRDIPKTDFDEKILLSKNDEKLVNNYNYIIKEWYSNYLVEIKNLIKNNTNENVKFMQNNKYIINPEQINYNINYINILKYICCKNLDPQTELENQFENIKKTYIYIQEQNDNKIIYNISNPDYTNKLYSSLTKEEKRAWMDMTSKDLFKAWTQSESILVKLDLLESYGGTIRVNKNGNYYYDDSHSIKYKAKSKEGVFSPFDGEVISVNKDKVGGSIIINSETHGRITITNVNNIMVSKNEKIKANDYLGTVGSKLMKDDVPYILVSYNKDAYYLNYDLYADKEPKYQLEAKYLARKGSVASLDIEIKNELRYINHVELYLDNKLIDFRTIPNGKQTLEFANIKKGENYTLKIGWISDYDFKDEFNVLKEITFKG